MKQLVGSTSGKSRQPNHIISCGGILSTKLASATVQDQAPSSSVNSKKFKLIWNIISFAYFRNGHEFDHEENIGGKEAEAATWNDQHGKLFSV